MRAVALLLSLLNPPAPVPIRICRPSRIRAARQPLDYLESRLLLTATTHLAFGIEPSGGFVGIADTPAITVDVKDAGGAIVTTDHSKITLTVATGPAGGKILGTFTVNAVNGVATFSNLLFSKAGAYTIKATDVTDAALTPDTSSSFTIQAAPVATSVVIVSQPANNAAGSTINSPVVVNVLDQYGHLFTHGHPSISLKLASAPAGGKLLGKVKVTATNGVATFTGLSLNEAGTCKLEAVDGALNGTSSSFSVTAPAVATSVIFSTQPASNAAGATVAPVVEVLDQYGHIFTSGHPSISLKLTSEPAGGKLLGKVKITATNGIATFTGLSLNEAGTYQLEAVDGALNATSGTFTVTAPSVAHSVAFVQQPGGTTAGNKVAPAVTVQVSDQYGHLLATDHSAITITAGSGPQLATFHATASHGIATFSDISFTKAGSYTLHAADGLLTAANATPFTVSAAAASQLAFTQTPSSNVAHAGPFTLKVDVLDKFGNIVTGNTSNITMKASNAPAGAMPVNLTVTAVAGVATFSNVAFSKAGTYVLQATDGVLTAAHSLPFHLT